MEGNNRNNTAHRRKLRLFRGKTKHILLLIPAVLILTCILALPLASGQNQTLTIPLAYGQIQANALPQTNSINSKGDILTLANPITLGSTTNNGVPLTVIGSMTVTGDSILNRDLDISNAQQVILGSPLYASGTMTLTGNTIELGKPCESGGTITIEGNSTWPAENKANGTLYVGNKNTGSEVYFNITNYYQYVESYGGGYIGDWNDQSNDIILPNSDIIRVYSGQIYIFSVEPPAPLTNWIKVWINHDWCNMTMNVLILGDIDTNINLWGNPSYSEENYNGKVNITQFALNGEFPDLILIDINDVILDMKNTPARYLTFDSGTTFDSWGPWFAVGSSEGAGGVMNLTDTYVYMNSSESISYQFLDDDEQAAITLEASSTYTPATMYVSTTDQSITGLGNSIITNGGVSALGVSDIRNVNQITEGTFEFTGNMLITGTSTIEGDIKITGYNKLQAPITVSGQMNVNNGLMSGTLTLNLPSGSMETNGELNIDDGEMNILQGTMEMNSTGIYVYGATSTTIGCTITSTGIMEITGNPSIQGNIGISGHSYMQGSISIRSPLLSLDGEMVTDGDMSIANGAINILNGHMVMDDAGSSITGDSIAVEGTVDFNGNATITGSIGIVGHSYMQGSISIRSPLLSLSGVMDTTGMMSITDGAINILNGHMVMDDAGSSITGDSIAVEGTVDFNGGATITGEIGISGYNYMQGLITVQGDMNINNGLTSGTITLTIGSTMETTGTMTITNGEISIPSGSMVMNDAGSFITGDTITVTGDQINSLGTTEVNGDVTMTGDIGISGYNYMEGLITVQGYININNGKTIGKINLTIDGTMETTGSMNITEGGISVPGGSIVMNSTGAYITGDTITVTGDQIASQGTTEVTGNTIMKGDFAMGGTSYIKGPVSISGSLNINFGTMMGTGTIVVSDGFMQTVGSMNIINGTVTVSGKIVMDSSGTHIGSTTSITGDTITVNGIVTNAGSVKMTGTFVLMIPMSMTGVMVTNGITAMGGLGTINGIMNVMGNIMMSGMTV
nr:hypothetical protein [Candidatus Freyarchaeota archaeon]